MASSENETGSTKGSKSSGSTANDTKAQQSGADQTPEKNTGQGSGDQGQQSGGPDDKSVGPDNPQQPSPPQGSNAGEVSQVDASGNHSRESAAAAARGDAPANATLGVNTGAAYPGSPPSEGAAYSPIPSDQTTQADHDGTGFTNSVQRLMPPQDDHPLARALGTPTNLPTGSRPMTIDPNTGMGLKPDSQGQAGENEGSFADRQRSADE